MTQREEEILKWIEENPLISQQELAEKAGITRSSVAVHISNLMKKGYIAGKGYVVQTNPYVVVIGGITKDIGGRPFEPLVAEDSNPGRVRVSIGGVGRNIAHNMTLMGLDVRFLTALGDDDFSATVMASCNEVGIDLNHSKVIPGIPTSTYLFICNEKGDMELALSDMEIFDYVTPEYLEANKPLINNAQVVVVDTNIPEQSLKWLTDNCSVPIFADPVSTKKAEKLKPILNKIHTLKPNKIEAEILTGTIIKNNKDLEKAAHMLLAKGVKRVFISLGKDGVFCAEDDEKIYLSCRKAILKNTTGGGDAFMAALVWAFLEKENLKQSGELASTAAAIAVESMATINPKLNIEEMKRRNHE